MATIAVKTVSKRAIRKITERTDDLVGHKIADKFMSAASNSARENSRKFTAAQIDETLAQSVGIPKERYIPLVTEQQ